MRIPDFELERYLNALEFSATHYVCGSDVEGYRLDELLALASTEERTQFEKLSLGYTTAPGMDALRDEIGKLYTTASREHVLTFAGAEEAIFILMNVLLSADDHAVVVWPAYQSLHEVARATGASVSLVELHESAAWKLDVEALRSAVTAKTRLIVINFPHNPTGATLDRASFDAVVEIARDAGAYLLSDEVYRFSEHDERDRLPAVADVYERGISLGVMSKSFALAGLRIGWLVSNDTALLERCASFKDYVSICNSAPSEVLSLIALRNREKVIARSLEIIRANLVVLDEFFTRWEGTFAWVKPRAGTIAFPSINTHMSIDKIARSLVEQEGVVILPASRFGHPGANFRIGFGRRTLPTALAAFEKGATRLGLRTGG